MASHAYIQAVRQITAVVCWEIVATWSNVKSAYPIVLNHPRSPPVTRDEERRVKAVADLRKTDAGSAYQHHIFYPVNYVIYIAWKEGSEPVLLPIAVNPFGGGYLSMYRKFRPGACELRMPWNLDALHQKFAESPVLNLSDVQLLSYNTYGARTSNKPSEEYYWPIRKYSTTCYVHPTLSRDKQLAQCTPRAKSRKPIPLTPTEYGITIQSLLLSNQ
jgi:hypothetical protein